MFPVDVPFIHTMLDGDFSWNRETSYDTWCFEHQAWGEIHQQTSWSSSNSRFAHPPQDNTHGYKVGAPQWCLLVYVTTMKTSSIYLLHKAQELLEY